MFVLLPLMYFWCRDPLHYPSRIRGSILCLFLFTAAVPSSELSSFGSLSSAAAGESDWEPNSTDPEDGALGAPRSRMREGTRIGSTTGKFYRNGRRWVFEFALPTEDASGALNHSSQQNVKEVREVVTTTNDRLTSSTTTITSTSSTSTTSSATTSAEPDGAGAPLPTQTVRLRVLENLALQRVVSAITEDSNDVHWTITGTVTEFGNENWLLLTTILRSPSGNSE